ncbi:mpv17-like protein 2 [Athalia rosae]|uniref:mpv17-like protein 2 n=1 Tax=Athalia rosae TaxID=37344 RepID=UPI0020334F67|nr:mpv17-like protein 2 [Athalia rosae]XP_012265164.2 mpv17-like protein 2 [Athalia rosae]XP_048508463.1 mpv17-like protein 2 [Athalia rosae]
MGISSRVAHLGTLPRRRPLFFNAIVYGSLYTSAEFVQQTWTKNHTFKSPDQNHAPTIIAVADGPTAWPVASVQKLNKVLGLDQDAATIPGDYNWAQLKRFAIYGCLLAGPILHGWYRWLDAVYSGTSKKIVFKKLLVDQFVLTPALLAFFFISMNLMEGKSDILAECKAKFFAAFGIACIYWIPVQTLNFIIVPPAFRVLYVGVAAFCWVNILCYVKRQPQTNNTKGECVNGEIGE